MAVGPARQDRRGEVRRQRHDRQGAGGGVRQGHRLPALRRSAAGGRARRRPADQRPAGPARHRAPLRRRAAGHHRRDHGRGPHGAHRPGAAGHRRDINTHGPFAVGMSGEDADTLKAVKRHAVVDGESVDIGRVGDIEAVNPGAINALLDDGRIPVVSSIARAADGTGVYNVNADTAAAALAVGLGAEKLVVLTDVEGLFADWPASDEVISRLSADELAELLPTLSSRDGAEDGGLPAGGARGSAARARPGRPGAARAVAGGFHRRGDRNDGGAGMNAVVASGKAEQEHRGGRRRRSAGRRARIRSGLDRALQRSAHEHLRRAAEGARARRGCLRLGRRRPPLPGSAGRHRGQRPRATRTR